MIKSIIVFHILLPRKDAIMARTVGSKNLSLREQRKEAEKAALKAENEALKAKLRVEQVKTKEAKAKKK